MSGSRTKLLRKAFRLAHGQAPTKREWLLWKREANRRRVTALEPSKVRSIATAGRKRAERIKLRMVERKRLEAGKK
jgi:hypothetical protein